MELDVDGTVFQARMLDERAPRTTSALWEILPFKGLAVHAQWSGDMFRMYEHLPVRGIDAPENGVAFQYPGLVVYYPPIHELAVCYGTARFRGAASALTVTPVAEIPAQQIDRLVERASKLQWDGAAPFELRQATVASMDAPASSSSKANGRRIQLQLGDAVATARLFEETAPRTCEAFLKVLPLEGPATNTKWSGDVTRFWGPVDGARGAIGLNMPPESETMFHWPGVIYYHSDWDGIRICYGNGQQSGAFNVSALTPLARFDGDWSAFRNQASRLFLDGSKRLSMRLLE
jgi:hypothetical protein